MDNNSSDLQENKFFNLLSFFVIFISVFIVSFSKAQTGRYENQPVSLLSQTKDFENKVLGNSQRNSEAPRIVINGGNGYSSGGIIPLASTDEPAVYISSYDFGGEVEISLYKADKDAVLTYLVHDKDSEQLNKKPDVGKYQLITSLKQNITSGYNNESKVTLPLEETGIWLIAVKSPKAEDFAFVVRSDFGVLTKEGDNQYIFWGQSFKTKRSIGSGSVKVFGLLGNIKEINGFSFNSEGIAKGEVDPNGDIAVAEFENNIAVIPLNLRYLNSYNWQSFLPKTQVNKSFVFVDRPIYKPGDTIYFKSVLRDDDDARYSLSSGQVTVKIYQDSTNPLFEKNLTIGNFGSIDGEFKLPSDVKVGYYSLSITKPGFSQNESYSYEHYSSNSVNFQIENYRKPEYSIDVQIPQKELINKDRLNFTISGNYFSGEALADQKVSYQISSSDYYNYEYFSDNNLFNDLNVYGYYGYEQVTSGEAFFNGQGNVSIDIEALPAKIEGKDKVFTVSATFDDGSGNPSYDRKNVLVYAGDFGIFRKDFGYGGVTGKEISIPLTLIPHKSGKINQIPLTVKIHRENWIPKYDNSQKYPTYVKEEEDLNPLSLKTNSKGEATISFVPQKVGSYIFTVQAIDAKQNLVVKDFYTWVTDKDYSYYSSDFGNDLSIQSEKKKYDPSEKVKLTIVSSTPDRDIFLSFERGRVDRYQIVHLNGKSAEVTVPLSNSDIPNIFASVSGFSPFAFDSGSVNIPVSAESKKVVVNITPDKKNYGPGQTVNLNIETTDIAGNPVSAETTVWAIDKALFELADSSVAKIFNQFWSERYDSTMWAHSLQGIISSGAEGGGCFSAETQILMKDGKTKNISEIKSGEEILTRKNEKSKELQKAKVANVHSAEVDGYLILNGNLRVTENHFMFVNDSWKQAGSIQIGDKLVDSRGDEISVSSVEWILGKFKVYNLEIEKYHTFFAGGVWVHNQKGGDNRQTFKDTAYWNPSVITDSSGRAKVSFKLPDNLTTWVVSGISATTDTKVGQNSAEIVVSKSIIVRPFLPNILRLDDKIIISSLVQNYTDIDQKFDVNLDFDSGSVEKAKYSSVLIKAGKSNQFYWTLTPKSENPKAKLSIFAQSVENKDASDGVTLSIPVVAYGFMEKKAVIGEGSKEFNININPDSDKEKSEIKLLLSSSLTGSLASSAKYLLNYPYGCSEQVTSSLVSALSVKTNPDIFSSAIEGKGNVDEIINSAIKKLTKLQLNDGGWNWWNLGNIDTFKTVYVVENLIQAKEAGYKVDSVILDRARNVLENNGISFKSPDQMVAREYALSLLGSNKRGSLPDLNNLTPDILSMAILTNIKDGNNNPETNGLNKLLSSAKEQGAGIYWEAGLKKNFGSVEASTALAIRAMFAGKADRATISKALRFLTINRKHDYWMNTFATSQTLQALLSYLKSENESTPNFTYSVNLDGKTIVQGNVTDNKKIKDVIVNLKDIKSNGSKLNITINGDGQLYETLLVNEFRTDKNLKEESRGLKIERKYVNEKGDDLAINVGDTVLAKITLSGLNTEEYFGVINDQLPSGLIPINEKLNNEQYGKDTVEGYFNNYVYSEIGSLNDIVLSIYKVEAGEQIFQYRARAVSEGEYNTLPIEASLMYAPEISGRGNSGTLKINKSKETIVEEPAFENPPVNNNLLKIIGAGAAAVIISALTVFFVYKKKTKPPLPPPAATTSNA